MRQNTLILDVTIGDAARHWALNGYGSVRVCHLADLKTINRTAVSLHEFSSICGSYNEAFSCTYTNGSLPNEGSN
jgi:hypothetical protein